MEIIVRPPTTEEIAETKTWPTWSKEISTFPWSYADQETCYILEGKATVKTEDGEEVSFQSGDWVVFPEGLNCTWAITEDIQKHYKFG